MDNKCINGKTRNLKSLFNTVKIHQVLVQYKIQLHNNIHYLSLGIHGPG